MTLSMLAAAGRANEGLYKMRRIACYLLPQDPQIHPLPMAIGPAQMMLTYADFVVAAKPMGPHIEGAQLWVEPGFLEPARQAIENGLLPDLGNTLEECKVSCRWADSHVVSEFSQTLT